MKTLALIDYGSGNLHSAMRALRAAGACEPTYRLCLTSDPEIVKQADQLVLPGVGHFSDCASQLQARPGLIDAMKKAVLQRAVPFLGICVGQQLLATRSLEDGVNPGLNWIEGDVTRIKPDGGLAVPHVGWNQLYLTRPHPVLAGLGPQPHVYFTHSYAYCDPAETDIAAYTDYGGQIIAAIARDNIFATQFHPEKSQRTGLQILSNFLAWTP